MNAIKILLYMIISGASCLLTRLTIIDVRAAWFIGGLTVLGLYIVDDLLEM
jgi:hypothetical protein